MGRLPAAATGAGGRAGVPPAHIHLHGNAKSEADLKAARDTAYRAVDAIDWPEGFCRRDIGHRALR